MIFNLKKYQQLERNTSLKDLIVISDTLYQYIKNESMTQDKLNYCLAYYDAIKWTLSNNRHQNPELFDPSSLEKEHKQLMNMKPDLMSVGMFDLCVQDSSVS